jgi:hypothetical protein
VIHNREKYLRWCRSGSATDDRPLISRSGSYGLDCGCERYIALPEALFESRAYARTNIRDSYPTSQASTSGSDMKTVISPRALAQLRQKWPQIISTCGGSDMILLA